MKKIKFPSTKTIICADYIKRHPYMIIVLTLYYLILLMEWITMYSVYLGLMACVYTCKYISKGIKWIAAQVKKPFAALGRKRLEK